MPSECRLQMSNAHTETPEHAVKAIHCSAVHDIILIIIMIILNVI